MNFSLIPLFVVGLAYASPILSSSNETLRIATIDAAPFVFRHLENDTVDGFIIDVLDLLKADLHFDYQLHFVTKYGQRNESGEWDGLIGEITHNKADMAAGPLTVTAAREEVVDFTISFMQTGLGVMFKKPKSGQKLPFHGFKDMVANDKFTYGVIKGGSTHRFLQNNRFKLFKEMGDVLEMHPDRLVHSTVEAVERVRNESFAFIGENRLIRYYARQAPCDLMGIAYPLQTISYALAFTPGHHLIDDVNMKILEMRETGVLHRLEEKWWPEDCVKPKMCVCQKPKSAEHSASHEHEETDD